MKTKLNFFQSVKATQSSHFRGLEDNFFRSSSSGLGAVSRCIKTSTQSFRTSLAWTSMVVVVAVMVVVVVMIVVVG